MSNNNLSKTLYCCGVQCPKMLWLKKYGNIPASSDNQAIFDNGNKLGDLAMGLLGDFVEVPYAENKREMVASTEAFLDAGEKVICEASFIYENLFCSLDILHVRGNMSVDFYEVKSSSQIKDVYMQDCAYQLLVLTKLGYDVNNVYLVNVDTSYVRQGELDIHKLFSIHDVTSVVYSMQKETAENIARLKTYMSMPSEPDIDLHLGCFSPYECDYWNYCASNLPEPSVFDLCRMNKDKMLSLYYEGKVNYRDLAGEKLTDTQSLQVSSYLTGTGQINRKEISRFMDRLSYPLYFLDFESFQPAVPPYDGTWPYMQIPFQYSLHWIDSPSDSSPKHTGLIAEAGKDPRRAVAESLCINIPDNVCVTAYYMSYEKGRLKELAQLFPDLCTHLMSIHDNIVDLEIPFSRRWYYLPAMNGSASIKKVLPALYPDDPELNYDNLPGDVRHGDQASAVYSAMAGMSRDEYERCYEDLWNYCKLDTYAMYKVWQKLYECSF